MSVHLDSLAELALKAAHDARPLHAKFDICLPGPVWTTLVEIAARNAPLTRRQMCRLLIRQDLAEAAVVGVGDRRLGLYRCGKAPRPERGGVRLTMRLTRLQREVVVKRCAALGCTHGGYIGALILRAQASAR